MRYLKFVEPNFKCQVSGPSGDVYDKWLLFANSEQEARDRLTSELFTVNKIEKYDFNDWRTRADRENSRAIAARNNSPYEYKQALWSEIKQFLFFISHKKCGYCEANVWIVSSGHVEHYRPRRKVEEDPSHPGYYWLAYDVDNYIPCCENCNSARGKRNHFPLIAGSPRAIDCSGISDERTLLLNPFKIDPSLHLVCFGPDIADKFGQIEGLTPEGKESVKVYNLNRGDLVKARQKSYETLRLQLKLAQASADMDDSIRKRILNELVTGECEFSIMLRPVIVEWLEERRANERRKIAEATLIDESLKNDLKMLR